MTPISPHPPIKSVLTALSQAAGKTILSVEEEYVDGHDYTVFRFTDGTGLLIRATSCEGDGSIEVENPLDSGWFSNDRVAVYFGLLPLAEYEARRARWEAESTAARERYEREQYRRLAAKYGEE